ncbi:MAG: signal peptide peptidase SppA [Treponema sp.]|nr:signal peptide peptidase SppA [Treponema sp.]
MSVSGKSLVLGMYCLISAPLFSNSVYLELNLNNQTIQERIRSSRSRPPLELFRVIERAARDKRIAGIVLNASGFSANQEYIWELRSALEEFKSHGKKICAFISAAGLDVYCLATVADKIVMDEPGALSLTGYSWGRGYVRHTLEKLGIGVRELRYLQYKSGSEMFTRDSISEADRRQYGEWLDDVFTVTRDTLIKARSWTPEKFDEIINREFLYSAKGALDRGLVDKLGREDAMTEALKEIEGTEVKSFVYYGENDLCLMDCGSFYGPKKAGFFPRPPIIAVVYANGQTDMERGMSARTLAKTIREISEKKRVKAIVIRINSPGGSAEAADYIAEAVRYAKTKIPVVVSMAQVAASGGYWAAMYANKIVASPHTLTGSIGVIGSWFYDNGMNSKLGLSVDVLQRGDHADMGSGFFLPRRDLNADEEERYRTLLLDMYADFKAKVSAGRGMDIEKVEAAAQGRVYSGIAALNAGLIDGIGGLTDAVRIARNLAEIPENKQVTFHEYPRPTFWDKVLDRLPTAFASIIAGSNLGSNLGRNLSSAALSSSAFLADMLPGEPLLAGLRYRISHNGRIMPILPMECGWISY